MKFPVNIPYSLLGIVRNTLQNVILDQAENKYRLETCAHCRVHFALIKMYY